jgi:hypothetical protein
MASAALDPEFLPIRLRDRIVEGARGEDPVRLHGAIVAALEIHRPTAAVEQIFRPALTDLRQGQSPPAADRAEAAIAAHLQSWRGAGGRRHVSV